MNFPANITMKGVIQAERSRMLDALQEDYAHSLEEKGIKETSFLSFSDSEEERGGNS